MKGSGIQFYRFPSDPEKRSKWVAAVRHDNWSPTEHSWICSEHFVSNVKSNNPLAPNYIPTIFQHVKTPEKRRFEAELDTFNRRQATKKRRLEKETAVGLPTTTSQCAIVDDDDESPLSTVDADDTCRQSDSSCMTYMVKKDIESLEKTQVDYEGLKLKHNDLEVELAEVKKQYCKALDDNSQLSITVSSLSKHIISEDSLKSDDKMVKYYTGLPSYVLFKAIFDLITVGLPQNFFNGSCSAFQQVCMVLMNLRLNLGDQDLAYRFGVNQSTVSRYFHKWLDVMYTKLSCLVFWPERGELLKTMPSEFRKHFKKCVIIIDCFEVFMERPTSLKPRAQTWSNYKKHNTVKFLIGITPQGLIAFISKGWGGRVSDVYLTENCGLLAKLLPGDMILADRGFTIQEAAGMYCAEVKMPPFTRGKKQLSKIEVDTARRLSRVRIHVERVIGMVRQKYSILQSTLPINMIMCSEEESVSTIDKIVTICCALCNCCDSIVPVN